MGLFDNKNFYYDLAVQKLSKNLVDRDSQGFFALDIFREFSKNYLFKNVFDSEPTQITVLQNYYNIARGSLDLPFTSSLAAHGYVSTLLLKKFASPRFIFRYQQEIETGEKIATVSSHDNLAATSLKKISANLIQEEDRLKLQFQKACVTNGSIADLLFTTLWHKDRLEIYALEKAEVVQTQITNQLVGFRTGDSGSVSGQTALKDIVDRRLTTGQDTMLALKYVFNIERLIFGVMASGLAHGLEDFLLKSPPASLIDAIGDNKQYLQEKILRLHITRVQMTSLIESIVHRGPEAFMQAESELCILKMMISNELRNAVYGCIEVIGHWALHTNNVLPKILRDIQMCSFFGGSVELQKTNLYTSISPNKKEIKAA